MPPKDLNAGTASAISHRATLIAVPVLSVFFNVMVPVFLMAGAGAALARFRGVAPNAIAQAVLYVFSPALAFHSLSTTEIPISDIGRMAAFSLLLLVSLFLAGTIAARVLRLQRQTSAAFLLSVLFMNAGNYGLPVALLAFGDEGLSRAVVFFVIQAMGGGTIGVFIASRGSGSVVEALKNVARVPLGYAAVAGLTLSLTGTVAPDAIANAARILGNAAVPGMLLVLGIQLFSNFRIVEAPAVIASAVFRLGISVGLAALFTTLLGIGDLTQKVLIVLAGMPSAVFITILATEFDARPDVATSAVLVSTILSLVTLTALIAIMTS